MLEGRAFERLCPRSGFAPEWREMNLMGKRHDRAGDPVLLG